MIFTPQIVAGIGCRRACPAEDIVALLRQAAAISGQTPTLLASFAGRAGHAGLHRAAAMLALPLVLVDDAAMALAQPLCATASAMAARETGFASVAEASALAACGPGAVLLLPRIAGARATCALARQAPGR